MELENELSQLKEKGFDAYYRKDYQQAAKYLEQYNLEKLEKGIKDDDDQVNQTLIKIYLSKETYNLESAKFYIQAESNGDPDYSYITGLIYALGIDCVPSYVFAARFFDEAIRCRIHYSNYSSGFYALVDKANLNYYGFARDVDKLEALYDYADGLYGHVRLFVDNIGANYLHNPEDVDNFINAAERIYTYFESFAKTIGKLTKAKDHDIKDNKLEISDIAKMSFEECKKYQEEHPANIEANFKMAVYDLLRPNSVSTRNGIRNYLKTNVGLNHLPSAMLLYDFEIYNGKYKNMLNAGYKVINMIYKQVMKLINSELVDEKDNEKLINAIKDLDTGMKKFETLYKNVKLGKYA